MLRNLLPATLCATHSVQADQQREEVNDKQTDLHLATADRSTDGVPPLVKIQSARVVKIRSAATVGDFWFATVDGRAPVASVCRNTVGHDYAED